MRDVIFNEIKADIIESFQSNRFVFMPTKNTTENIKKVEKIIPELNTVSALKKPISFVPYLLRF